MRLGDGALDQTGHLVAVLGADQRAEFGVLGILEAGLEAGDGRAQALDEAVIDTRLHIQAAGRRAVLAGVVEAERANAIDGGVDIGIIEHQHRRLAAQLHVHTFHTASGSANDVRAGGNGAGQRHHAHFGVGDQRVADRLPTAEQDIEHAGWQQVLASSPRRRAVSGVSSEGLMTTVLPAARAGAIFHASIING